MITRQPDYEAPGAVVVHDREELAEALKECGGEKGLHHRRRLRVQGVL